MTTTNYFDWATAQMKDEKASTAVQESVIRLLNLWEALQEDLTAEESVKALNLFPTLAVGHAIPSNEDEGTWVPAQRGFLTVGDVVRVKSDAFFGEVGTYHNGRVGRITGIRSGDIIVRSTDNKEPKLDGIHYAPNHLEKRVK